MAKDPAFLWYPNDWLGGTLGMTFEEKGAYMELLMMQFNRGHMGGHMVGQVVGQLWDNIREKFQVDEQGLYYNERLEQEINKRKTFVESRKNNLTGKNQYSDRGGHMDGHMRGHVTSHMENENDNNNISSINTVLNTSNDTTDSKKVCHKHGEYGWVLLTDAQYEKLQKDLGQAELDRCIRVVDESAQSTGNRNKWKDWNLTVRKCSRDGWGLKPWEQKPQTPKPTKKLHTEIQTDEHGEEYTRWYEIVDGKRVYVDDL